MALLDVVDALRAERDRLVASESIEGLRTLQRVLELERDLIGDEIAYLARPGYLR